VPRRIRPARTLAIAEVFGLEIDRTYAGRSQPLRPVESTPSASASAAAREAAEPRQDRIELSAEAREITGDPDAREAKLEALRARIEAGTYRVDAEGVARFIVARKDL